MQPFEFVKFLESRASNELALIRQKRPYRTPKGYPSWRFLSGQIAGSLMFRSVAPDPAAYIHHQRAILWYCQNAPVYCLSKELLRSFHDTDILDQAELLSSLQPPLPTLLLLFPQNAITTPEGDALDWSILHWSDRAHPERSQGSADGYRASAIPHGEHPSNLHWSAVDNGGTLWYAGTTLTEDGRVIFSHDAQVGQNLMDAQEQSFLDQMRSLALQVFLALTYRDDLISISRPADRAKGFAQLRKQENAPLFPRWLGKEYVRPKASYSSGKGSPRSHWRRGHWRQQAIGAGRKQRKVIWIEPTFIKGESS